MTSGRPRKPETDHAILEAALAVFGEAGYEGMSIEAVAAKAGVGKATIYRRWSSKDDLIIGAMQEKMTEIQVPDTGDFRADLTTLITGALRFMKMSSAGVVFPRMAGEVAARTPLGLRYVETVIGPRRAVLRGIIGAAVERGLVRDLDVSLMADMLMGPIIMRKILNELGATDEDTAAHLVGALLEGWLSHPDAVGT